MSPQVPGFPGHGPLPGAHDERQGNLANRPRTFRSGRSTPAVGLPAPDMSHATSLSRQVRATTVAQTSRAADSAPTSSLTMSDSSAHAALLTPQFSAAFPRFLHTHAETPTPSSRLTGKLVRKCRLFHRCRPGTLPISLGKWAAVSANVRKWPSYRLPSPLNSHHECNTVDSAGPASTFLPSAWER